MKKNCLKDCGIKQTINGPAFMGCSFNGQETYDILISFGFVDIKNIDQNADPKIVIKPKFNTKGRIVGVYGSGTAMAAWMGHDGFDHLTTNLIG